MSTQWGIWTVRRIKWSIEFYYAFTPDYAFTTSFLMVLWQESGVLDSLGKPFLPVLDVVIGIHHFNLELLEHNRSEPLPLFTDKRSYWHMNHQINYFWWPVNWRNLHSMMATGQKWDCITLDMKENLSKISYERAFGPNVSKQIFIVMSWWLNMIKNYSLLILCKSSVVKVTI